MTMYTQIFYNKKTGERHEVSIGYKWNGYGEYEVNVDGNSYAKAKFKTLAFDIVGNVIRDNDWSPIKRNLIGIQ